MKTGKIILAMTLLAVSLFAQDTLILKAGLNGFYGIYDASIHNPPGGARMGSPNGGIGSSWC